MRIKKKRKLTARYIPLDDIEAIDAAYLNEINNVRGRLNGCNDSELVNAFFNVLLSGYKAAIELKTLERAVDYDIKFAEIEERRRALRPWRRCWLWRLLFRPLTNRAQDIIEARAELDADEIHSAAEKEIDDERKNAKDVGYKKLSKRELKRIMREKLKAAIEKADKDTSAAFDEPANAPPEQEQPQEQLRLDVLATATRRPRPPRSCRK